MLNLKALTDEQLVVEFKQTRNNEIFGEIYNRYYKKVYNTCLGYTKSKDAAFDLVQDIMLKIIDKLPSLDNGNLLGLWIHRVASNYCADNYKKTKRFSMESLEDRFDIASEETDMEALAAKEVLFDKMENLLADFDEETLSLLRLKYQEGNSIKELEVKLNLSASAIKMRLKRGRNKISKLYNSQQRVAMS